MIMGGGKKQLSLDNYAMGAAIIYMDIISLFLKILQILGDKKKKDWMILYWPQIIFKAIFL